MMTLLVWVWVWVRVSASRGYELALGGRALRCRRTDGGDANSLPKGLLGAPADERLAALR